MTLLIAAAAVAAVLVLLFTVLAARCVRRGRTLATMLSALLSTLFVVAGIAVVLVGGNLSTWSRMAAESPAAVLTFARTGERAYDADIALADGRHQRVALRGDEWQVDARILKWRPFASLLGFDTVFRLDRVSGRYADIDAERAGPRSVASLHPADQFDVWALVRAAQPHLPWVDALYGSAVFLPMADGATFAVSMGPGGLVARPRNDAARVALAGWH
ncbi:MAG: hypothetical protein ABI190_05465 [Casimicrobiaceae bacterium]